MISFKLKINRRIIYHLRYFNYKPKTFDLKLIKEHGSWCQRACTKTISCNTIKIPFLRVSFLFLQQVEHLPEFQRKAIFCKETCFQSFLPCKGFMAQTRYYLINVSLHQLILFQRIVYFEERRERHQKGYKHNLKRFSLNLEAFQKKNLFYLYVNFELSK